MGESFQNKLIFLDETSMAAELKELENRVFGSWRLLTLVDSGGMGAIFQGQHTELGTRVAVKVLLAGFDASQEVVVRFLNEAKIGANVIHPNIARTIDLFRDAQGRNFIVMEWLAGESLGRRLARGPCMMQESVDIFIGACRGLAAAHRANVVHRDIKPGNVFLALEHGQLVPKLIDFGIARLAASSSHTKTGLVMGSPPYMAPEQWKGAKFVTTQTDIFSLGVVLYEMLTGSNPFNGETIPEISTKITTQQLPPHPSVPPQLHEVLLRATARVVESRIATVDQLADQVAAATEALHIGSTTRSSPDRHVLPQQQKTQDSEDLLPILSPTFDATIPHSPVGMHDAVGLTAPMSQEPSPSLLHVAAMPPVYAQIELVDDHAIENATVPSMRLVGEYALFAGPLTAVAVVVALLADLGTSFADSTASIGAATMICASVALTAFFVVGNVLVTGHIRSTSVVRPTVSALAIALLLFACWSSLVATGEIWSVVYASLSNMPWRRDPIRKEILHFGMDTGAMWALGLLLGAIVTWIRSATEDTSEDPPAA